MVIRQVYIRCRDDARRGQMVVVFALSIAVFVGALALGVDLSHVRTEAENAQRAANAAALAGVIFMPNYQSQATYRAQEEATKNGFTDGQNSTSVTVSSVPPYSYRLRVTISELVPIFFGHLFGLGNVRISRSATAEYLPPLQMGSPDYVLTRTKNKVIHSTHFSSRSVVKVMAVASAGPTPARVQPHRRL